MILVIARRMYHIVCVQNVPLIDSIVPRTVWRIRCRQSGTPAFCTMAAMRRMMNLDATPMKK